MKKKSDLRPELKARMDKVFRDVEKLKAKRLEIDQQLKVAQEQLSVWLEAYAMEAERLGKPVRPRFEGGTTTYGFTGMRLVDAVAMIRDEHPEASKRQVRAILEKNGFDFRGKNPGQAVHFAWVAVDNRKKKGGE